MKKFFVFCSVLISLFSMSSTARADGAIGGNSDIGPAPLIIAGALLAAVFLIPVPHHEDQPEDTALFKLTPNPTGALAQFQIKLK